MARLMPVGLRLLDPQQTEMHPFTAAFDTVFTTKGMEIVPTPCQVPPANAIAERWGRSVRQECLDPIVVLGQRHLRSVLIEYIDFYNRARPHQGIHQQTPIALPACPTAGAMCCLPTSRPSSKNSFFTSFPTSFIAVMANQMGNDDRKQREQVGNDVGKQHSYRPTRGVGRPAPCLFSPSCLTAWRQRGWGFPTMQAANAGLILYGQGFSTIHVQ
jgi:hypothetical protein